MAEPHAVILRDKSSGRYHRAAESDQGILSHEADNLDQSGDYETLEALPPNVAYAQLCQRCFGPSPE